MPLTIDQIQTLQLELTSYCNAKCPHCPRFDSEGNLESWLKLSHWDMNTVISNLLLDKLTSLNEVRIEGDKGDPCMHPDLDLLLNAFAAAPSRPIVTLNTNGSIRNPEWWAHVASIPNLKVMFSIDGLADTNHIYRVDVSWEKLIANTRAFINAGGEAIWKCLVFKHNQHQVDEILNFSRDEGFAHVSFQEPFISRFQGQPQWPVKVKGQFRHILEPTTITGYQTKTTTHIPLSRGNPNQIISNKTVCPNLSRGHLYITHQHHVIPCCMMHSDLYQTYTGTEQLKNLVGGVDSIDISKRPIDEVLQSQFYNDQLQEHFFQGNIIPTCIKSCEHIIHTKIQVS